jgi:serine/threonine protein kinase
MTANEFLDLLRRSQLVEEDQLMQLSGLTDDAETLAASMVRAGLITEWQSEKLLAGKHKGFLLGKYKLLRRIGESGGSQVYEAMHTLMKRLVAIKIMPANRIQDSLGYEIDINGNTYYIVMELKSWNTRRFP